MNYIEEIDRQDEINRHAALVKQHKERKGYNSSEPWLWGLESYSGVSCACGCGLTLKDLEE